MYARPPLFVDVVDGNDAGVGQPSGRLRFAEEPVLQRLCLVRRGLIGQPNDLDRDVASDAGVMGLVDDAHRPPAEFADDLVASNARHAPGES